MIKHWGPRPSILKYLDSIIPAGARVLEIGPGDTHFARATHFVDRVPRLKPCSTVNVTDEPLPFADKFFDFIYCRHVVEDLYNPFLLLREMNRVGKAGYIETPSPVVELTRGVDGGRAEHRGYIHHRWIVWTAYSTLCLVEKATIVEQMNFHNFTVDLEEDPFLWNTYLLWNDRFSFKHFQHDVDFQLQTNYLQVLDMGLDGAKSSAVKMKTLSGG